MIATILIHVNKIGHNILPFSTKGLSEIKKEVETMIPTFAIKLE
jgi:hypothetical protein